MTQTREYAILEILSEYKWDESFTCKKCGSTKYKKGKYPFSRRCPNDHDESVQKYSALEGVKVIEKAYDIIEFLVENSKFYNRRKDIEITETDRTIHKLADTGNIEDNYNTGKLVSVNDILKMRKDGKISINKTESIVVEHWTQSRPYIAQIAAHVNVEENTVIKLIEKIDSRIPIDEENESMTPLQRVVDFFHWPHANLDHILGFLMFPLDEKWNRGEATIDGVKYALRKPKPDRNGEVGVRWRIVEID